MKRAEAYDQNCNRGKITGQVKAKGHSANFDKNRQLLSDELNKGFRETTKGSDAEVNGILQQIANDASAQMKKDIDRNGCYTEEADHAEGVLKLFSSIEPQFLFRSLQEHIALEVGKSQ
ncbi:MAG: hypothetical protein KJ667_01275 [Alphaproteobacteria bacterium]|nr:hypothetical protein [Alphaproteobacteria bacterium]